MAADTTICPTTMTAALSFGSFCFLVSVAAMAVDSLAADVAATTTAETTVVSG